jgi:annexin A7/11
MSEDLEKFEAAVMANDEKALVDYTINHSNEERVKLREEYKTKYGRELLEDFEKKLKSDFQTCMIGLYKSPAEYDADLLYIAMKGIGSDKDVITEVLTFRSPERINEIKEKFQEKYKKDLVAEIKDETSGDYRKIAMVLMDGKRGTNSSPDLENCKKIAKEIYDAGEGKIGTNEDVFIKYFTELSKEELLLVCKEYHKNHKKNMLDTIDNEFGSHVQKLLKVILYSLFAPAEFYARQIHDSVAGIGTADKMLIRSILSREGKDMKKIRKYYKKIYNAEIEDDIKGDISGAYQDLIVGLLK